MPQSAKHIQQHGRITSAAEFANEFSRYKHNMITSPSSEIAAHNARVAAARALKKFKPLESPVETK